MDGIQSGVSQQATQAARNSDLVQARGVEAAARKGDSEKASKMFEELLATMLVREMRRELSDGFFGSGAGADIYEGWLDQNVGRALAETGSLDLAQSIRVSLDQKKAQAQEAAQ